ncbi:MAG: STAS-like domain-containing protein [Candidatus Brocadiae bacterium]|nr:STAS-like domain-containing protein [Candidatus Brocadiia bacterium]
MKLIIKDIIGPRCITQEDGQKIYEKIHNPLLKGESIILNFEGVRQFASPFFNFAIGQLLKDIKTETLRSLLSFDHLTPAGKMVVERVIENASVYHTDIDYKKIVDSILEEQEKESK